MTSKALFLIVILLIVASLTSAAKPKPQKRHRSIHHGSHSHRPLSSLRKYESSSVKQFKQPIATPKRVKNENRDKNGQHPTQTQNTTMNDKLVTGNMEKQNRNFSHVKTNLTKTKSNKENVYNATKFEGRGKSVWIDCNYDVKPRRTCQDCKNRFVCRYPGSGKVTSCTDSSKPYCNDGHCSAVPTAGCHKTN